MDPCGNDAARPQVGNSISPDDMAGHQLKYWIDRYVGRHAAGYSSALLIIVTLAVAATAQATGYHTGHTTDSKTHRSDEAGTPQSSHHPAQALQTTPVSDSDSVDGPKGHHTKQRTRAGEPTVADSSADYKTMNLVGKTMSANNTTVAGTASKDNSSCDEAITGKCRI